jgi:integrase
MLRLARRHLASCPHRSQTYRRCKCPVWVFGTKNGIRIRKSLNTFNWEHGEELVRQLDIEPKEIVSVRDACARFTADATERGLGTAQLGKYKLLTTELETRLREKDIASVSVDDLREYRESWKMSPVSAQKKLERLRTFFKFCHESEWIDKNPALVLKSPKVRPNQVMPFSKEDWEKVLWATEVYPERPKGRRAQVKAFVLLLRYSGLRIGDAVSLERSKINDGKLFIISAKAKTPVWLPLPEIVLSSLQQLQTSDRYFWSGEGKLKSAVADWQRSLGKLFKLAGVKGVLLPANLDGQGLFV